MISSEYKDMMKLIEQHSWRINSLISLIEHNEEFNLKFSNSQQNKKTINDNENYKENIKKLHIELMVKFIELAKIKENDI